MRTLFLLIFVCAKSYGQAIDSIKIVCTQRTVSFVSLEDMMRIYRQRDSLHLPHVLPISFVSDDRHVNIQGPLFKSTFDENPDYSTIWADTLAEEQADFAAKKDSLLRYFEQKGWNLRYIQAVRNLARQRELNRMGRSNVLLSFHNFNLAADVAIYRRGRYLRKSARYVMFGEQAKANGLFWGGDFVGFPDPGHIQAYTNSSALIRKHPILAIEFEKYRDHYVKTYQKAVTVGRENTVLDTKALLLELNRALVDHPCACKQAILPPVQFANPPTFSIDIAHQWVFMQGYFYALGFWEYAKN